MMAYESPITLIQAQTDNFIKEINEKTDEVIFKAVINVLPQVDKEELIKALAYDREQYSKGYHDRDSEIVRCKDCKHRETDECPMYWMEWLIIDEGDGYEDNDYIVHDYTTDNGYCHCGKRKGGENE